MELSTFTDRLDDRLDTAAYADVDASANGLQVGPRDKQVDRVAFAVDAATATIEDAAREDADVLVVHHGLSWGGIDRVTDRSYERIGALVESDLALYVSHLPLDGHQELGNAAGVADELDVDPETRQPFGEIGPVHIGTIGDLDRPRSISELRSRLDRFDQGDRRTQVLPFGPDTVERVAIVTGSGTDWLDEAIEKGADALITGEGKQQVYHQARDSAISVFLAGHYATETFGVRTLMELADDWGLETTFVDHPTEL